MRIRLVSGKSSWRSTSTNATSGDRISRKSFCEIDYVFHESVNNDAARTVRNNCREMH